MKENPGIFGDKNKVGKAKGKDIPKDSIFKEFNKKEKELK